MPSWVLGPGPWRAIKGLRALLLVVSRTRRWLVVPVAGDKVSTALFARVVGCKGRVKGW